MFVRVLLSAVVAFVMSIGIAGCEKVDHDNIDKWPRTAKGPAKLKKAVSDEGIDADLSAHAAANLVKMGADPDVYTALETMSPGRRNEVIGKLAPRLWEIARVDDEAKLPAAPQIAAKDALVRVRKWADDTLKPTIDGYLIDYYCVASYEARAQGGAFLGATVMRLVGPAASKKLISVVNGVIAAPGQDKTKNKIGDELLLGLSATGSPDAVKYVLDIAKMDRGDATLAKRALSALYKAYVDPQSLFDVLPPAALVPNLDGLVEIAKNDAADPQVANDAVALIRSVGTPGCLQPLISMVAAAHHNPQFKYVAANNALKCGGTASIVDVVNALPDTGAYWKDELTGAVSGEIAHMSPRDKAVAAARQLLGEKSVISKWVGIEALGALKSTEDAPKIAALGSNKDRLVGYWGERAEGKPDPTLGERAKEVSALLAGK